MSYELQRLDDGQAFELSNYWYGRVLQIAAESGWIPQGTALVLDDSSIDKRWDANDYTSHRGQLVKSADAKNLSRSLLKASKDKRYRFEEREICLSFCKWLEIDGEYPGFEVY